MQSTSFREAIANWRLTLHTEVKRSSSLPTAMFDACDPMLETRLAETAEAMLAQLQQPDPILTENDDAGELRLEVVTEGELRRLPQRIRETSTGPVDLADGISTEYLGVLTDACCSSSGIAQQRAVQRLGQDFDVRPRGNLDELVQELSRHAQTVLRAGANPAADDDLETVCRRIAATVMLQATMTTDAPEPEPRP